MGDTDVVRIEISRYESENSSGEHRTIPLIWLGRAEVHAIFSHACAARAGKGGVTAGC